MSREGMERLLPSLLFYVQVLKGRSSTETAHQKEKKKTKEEKRKG